MDRNNEPIGEHADEHAGEHADEPAGEPIDENVGEHDAAPPVPQAQAVDPAVVLDMVVLVDSGNWHVFGDVISNDPEVDPNMTLEAAGHPGTTLLQYAITHDMPQPVLLRFLNRIYRGEAHEGQFISLEQAFWEIGAVRNHWAVINLILNHYDTTPAFINFTPPAPHPSSGITVLDLAIRRREWETARLLLEHGADQEAAAAHFAYPGIIRAIMARPQVMNELFARFDAAAQDMHCPISLDLILDPINLVVERDGALVPEQQIYDRVSIAMALRRIGDGQFRSPFTRAPVVDWLTNERSARDIEDAIMTLSRNIAEVLNPAVQDNRHGARRPTTPPPPDRQRRPECPGAPRKKPRHEG